MNPEMKNQLYSAYEKIINLYKKYGGNKLRVITKHFGLATNMLYLIEDFRPSLLTKKRFKEDLQKLLKLSQLEVLSEADLENYKNNQILTEEELKIAISNIVSIEEFLDIIPKKAEESEDPKNAQEGVLLIQQDENLIRGELLESFSEILLGELEMLNDTSNQEIKKFLIDILFDPNIELANLIKYVNRLDPLFGPRFAILYCCLNPLHWNDDNISEYKKVFLDSYIKRSMNNLEVKNPNEYEIRYNFLTQYANRFVKQFFDKNEIKKPKLNEQEESLKKSIIDMVKKVDLDKKEVFEDGKILQEESNELLDLIKEENCVVSCTSLGLAMENVKKIETTQDSWKLNRASKTWQFIYELIKYTPTSKIRPEDKMHLVVQAILYREEKEVRWKDIPYDPVNFPKLKTSARYYYHLWKSNGLLEKIKQQAYEELSNDNLIILFNKLGLFSKSSVQTQKSTTITESSKEQDIVFKNVLR